MKINKVFGFFTLFLVCLILVFVSIQDIFASGEAYPLPRDAVFELEQSVPVGPTTSIVRSYSTMLNKDQIESFFRKELLKLGWQEQSIKGLGYVKDDKIISVLVLPGKPFASDKKTYFSLVYATKISDEMVKASQKDKPDNLNFMPIYPGSKQLLLWDNANGVMAHYSTEDPISNVAAFFKSKMSSYGWQLSYEKPITDRSADCPECNKKIASLKNKNNPPLLGLKGKFYTSDLKFQRAKGEFCSISITSSNYSQDSFTKEAKEIGYAPVKETNRTKITVSYRDMDTNAQR